MKRRAPDKCLVCGRDKDTVSLDRCVLPSGREAGLCTGKGGCAKSRFTLAEAERRLDEQERKTA